MIAAASDIVAANVTSCPQPTSVCANPSSSAMSAPIKITLHNARLLSHSLRNPLHLDDFCPRGGAGQDAHIAPRISGAVEMKSIKRSFASDQSQEKRLDDVEEDVRYDRCDVESPKHRHHSTQW